MRRSATALVLAAAALAGCGDEPMSRAEYAREGNRLCVEQRAKAEHIQREALRGDRQRLLYDIGRNQAETRRRFKALRPPEELERDHDEMIEVIDDFNGTRGPGDLQRLQGRLNVLLKRLGLTRCTNA